MTLHRRIVPDTYSLIREIFGRSSDDAGEREGGTAAAILAQLRAGQA